MVCAAGVVVRAVTVKVPVALAIAVTYTPPEISAAVAELTETVVDVVEVTE